MPQSPLAARRTEAQIVADVQAALAGAGVPSPALSRELDQLFENHQDRIYYACLRIVGHPERARDLSQDTLLTAYQKLPDFRGDCAFGTWLFGIARFLCYNAVRRRGELLLEDEVVAEADPGGGALTQLSQYERERLLRDALQTLQPEEQEAVHLRYVEQLPQETISSLLGLETASGARGLLQRCRRKLRRELYRRLEEMGHGSSFIREVSWP